MGNDYIVINGISTNLTDEQVARITDVLQLNTAFDKNEGHYYGVDTERGGLRQYYDGGDILDQSRYDIGNYCRDFDTMYQRALHETLNRLLWRYSMTHGGDAPYDGNSEHWLISGAFSYGLPKIRVACESVMYSYGTVHFYSREAAEGAVEDVLKPFLREHPRFELFNGYTAASLEGLWTPPL